MIYSAQSCAILPGITVKKVPPAPPPLLVYRSAFSSSLAAHTRHLMTEPPPPPPPRRSSTVLTLRLRRSALPSPRLRHYLPRLLNLLLTLFARRSLTLHLLLQPQHCIFDPLSQRREDLLRLFYGLSLFCISSRSSLTVPSCASSQLRRACQ